MKCDLQRETVPNEIDIGELPVSGAVRVVRRRGYGTIRDLEDEAPAEVGELQRLVAWDLYGPLLALPGRGGHAGDAVLTPDGEVDWARTSPVIARRCPQRVVEAPPSLGLRERLAHAIELAALIRARIPGTAKYLVLKYVRMGILPIEEITNERLRRLVGLDADIRRLSWQLERTERDLPARASALRAKPIAQQHSR